LSIPNDAPSLQNIHTVSAKSLSHYPEVSNMTLDDFHQSLTATKPPAEFTLALAGLWWEAKGDWARAHESAQQDERPEGSCVHAYLHRKEGDQDNAAYWYGRAGKPVGREPLDAEWISIATALLGQIGRRN